MFEKSLYDLIRGMRNHKGKEKEYIQNCLKECRAEVRSQDMDLKATALLKLIYLEMFGNDMSWASFHVLEVMSSAKYHQKRIGYLGAVQTFRPDTEVLMLATNLLKKDLVASTTTTIGLPIVALPHVITPSLALSVLPDLLPRLSHTHPNVRKKTIVTLYRLALVYPETLRAAWPKIKERLMDRQEDASVTAAIVNVVCELGWRRPRDFLPLAPRLFELLVDSGNNWMAIKLIKLFATLTPLEPRLVKKLLPPLTEIIQTTPAMSLLYECINGIIQGGILGDGDSAGQEEIAALCVSKLRSMIMIDGDANLKYVALLAFNKIVVTHPWLVAQQEDVILECIDSTDISIRVNALDLVQGMVNTQNLVSIVSRLMRQLKASVEQDDNAQDPNLSYSDDDTDSAPQVRKADQAPPVPDEYKFDVINRILNMCSQNNYGNLDDFEWYIDVLTQLVRMVPAPRNVYNQDATASSGGRPVQNDVSERVGNELRAVTVKVQAIRPACVQASETTVALLARDTTSGLSNVPGALNAVAWILGEYSSELLAPEDTLAHILQLLPKTQSPESIASCTQAVMKIFSLITGDDSSLWTPQRKSKTLLLMARVVDSFEKLASHPNLEVQERAVEFTELLKLTTEAATSQDVSTDTVAQDTPLLLTQAIPSLFNGWTLSSVAAGAQKNVPLPDGLDLDEPINDNLNQLLASADFMDISNEETDEFEAYYHQKPAPTSLMSEPAINRLADKNEDVGVNSYQQPTEDMYLDADIVARRKAERQDKNKDDPFYIGGGMQRSSTPIHNILQNSNGPDLDVDAIPIMKLDLGNLDATGGPPSRSAKPAKPRIRQKIEIAADENLGSSGANTPKSFDSDSNNNPSAAAKLKARNRKLLGVDSVNIGSLSLEGGGPGTDADAGPQLDPDAQKREEAEMAKAMKEVERLRLEMQRANERIQVAQGVDAAGTVVKKKKTKKVKPSQEGDEQALQEPSDATAVKPKKKKKKAKADEGDTPAEGTSQAANAGEEGVVKAKPKKKKKVARTVQLGGDDEVEA